MGSWDREVTANLTASCNLSTESCGLSIVAGTAAKQLFVTLKKKIKSKKAYSMPRSSRTSTWKVVRYVGVGKEQTETAAE